MNEGAPLDKTSWTA